MKAIIVGAGISGLSTGVGLRRAGAEVTVFERGRGLASVQAGGGMHLWNNAMSALQRMGIAERVESVGEGVDHFSWYTNHGRLMGSGDVTELTRRVGAPAVGLTRADLHSALTAAAGDDMIQFGSELTGFEADATGVTVRLADGREERADVLIGADGIKSKVREQLQGEAEPRYSGVVVCQAVAKSDQQLIPPRVYGMLWGRGTRFGYYPVNGGAFWYLLVAAPKDLFADPASRREKIAKYIAGWADPVPRLLETSTDADLIPGNIVDREPAKKWGEGRVTMVGDAAHAMTPFLGQGGGQGIEDAAVLTECLKGATDLPRALRAYENMRRGRTADITRRAFKVGQTTSLRNPVACAVRNRLMTVLFPRVVWKEFSTVISTNFIEQEAPA
jgi:2-polyprenyl-6-methoxyphenol hydroxylase-like FAD-dependent oxidoreductase